MKHNKTKQQQTELWSNPTMQRVVLGVISNMTFVGKTYINDNPLSVIIIHRSHHLSSHWLKAYS